MKIFVILHYLRNNGMGKFYTSSLQMQIFFKHFKLWLAESVDAEPTATKGPLYLYLYAKCIYINTQI
jgi:hypothetical protein